MSLLFDTQLILWAASNDTRLPSGVRATLLADAEARWFSVVSLWEVAIKRSRYGQRFRFEAGPLRTGLLRSGSREIEVRASHVLAAAELPPLHGDPFDRMLVAQARVEGLTLLTTDRTLAGYGDPVVLA